MQKLRNRRVRQSPEMSRNRQTVCRRAELNARTSRRIRNFEQQRSTVSFMSTTLPLLAAAVQSLRFAAHRLSPHWRFVIRVTPQPSLFYVYVIAFRTRNTFAAHCRDHRRKSCLQLPNVSSGSTVQPSAATGLSKSAFIHLHRGRYKPYYAKTLPMGDIA